ncbi:hypothetical protein TELCIR_02467, partial [Teladorsagia circumcincta]
VIEVEPIDCNPGMLSHPMALLRWFHLLMYFLLQWLVQITCGNDACTMIMNVFGYTAMGQVNYQGRGKFHIKGQWIAAAVFEFLMALLFIGDFLLQRRENYPFTGKQYKNRTRTVQATSRPQLEIYTAPPITTTKTTTKEEYFTQPQQDMFNQQSRI